jgi:hypothetical protein
MVNARQSAGIVRTDDFNLLLLISHQRQLAAISQWSTVNERNQPKSSVGTN